MKPKERNNISAALKKSWLLLVLLSASITSGYTQNLHISGGNTVSTIMCTNGFMYTWGDNTGERLGHDGPQPYTTSPRQVLFPTNDPYFNSLGRGIEVRNVDAGSGAHFIASDCYGGVWSWGINPYGQIGIGENEGVVSRPTRVLRGEHPGGGDIHPSLADYLVDITFIAGGNEASYVVTKEGEVLAWGRNNLGQLGIGEYTDFETTPRYVLTGPGQRLTNVVEVGAGDYTAYARTADGRIFSWGAGTSPLGGSGMLGRNAAGTANNGNEVANDNFARPVLMRNGQPLRNIVSLNAGDVMCLALDADGFVWAWGNAGWGGNTGQGATATHSDPRRVLAGEWGTAPGSAGLGETFLRARSISGGQGFGTAVTIDGIPVAWGNNGACGVNAAGGSLGNGGTTASSVPVIIRTGANNYHSNVIQISAADTWGYYITEDNQIFTWGNNGRGQLGLGNTTCRNYATQFSLPACTFPAPNPEASISPSSFSVCSAKWDGTILNSNFIVGSALASDYAIRWYKDGDLVRSGHAGNAATYLAELVGEYSIEIEYIGDDIPCTPYEIARDTILISEWPQEFSVPDDLTFCGDSITANVATGQGLYEWFTEETGGVSLGTSVRTGNVRFPKTSVTEVNEQEYTVYVEEIGFGSGNVGSVTPPGCTPTDQSDPKQTNSMITVFDGNVTIDTVSVYHYGNGGATGNRDWQVCIYGSRLHNQRPIADRDNVIACGPVVSFPNHNINNDRIELRIPVEVTLEGASTGTDYWIGFSSNTTGERTTYFECNPNYPVLDDLPNGEFVSMVNADKHGNGNQNPQWGQFANIQFTAEQRFCTRVPVTITEECPCTPPNEITFASTDTSICVGEDLIISATIDTTDLTPLKGYHFTWFHNGVALGTASTTYVNLELSSITTDQAGTYTLRVEDGNEGTISCFLEESIDVIVHEEVVPGAIESEQTICTGTSPLELITATAASGGDGSGDFTWQWQVSTTGVADEDFSDISGEESESLTAGSLTQDTYFRRVAYSGECPGRPTDPILITVVEPVDPGTIGEDIEICENTVPPIMETVTPATGGLGEDTYIYQWEQSIDGGNTWTEIAGAIDADFEPTNPISVETHYRRKVSSGPCDAEYTNTVIVSIRPELIPGTIQEDQQTCYNIAPSPITNVTLATGGTGTYDYSWESSTDGGVTWNPESGTGEDLTLGGLITSTMYRRVVTSGTETECNTAYTTPITITVYNEPTPGSIGDDQIICSGDTPALISNIEDPSGGDATYTYRWFASTTGATGTYSTVGGVNPDFQAGSLTQTTWFVREVTSGNCPSVNSLPVQVEVVDPLTAGTIGTDAQICGGTSPGTLTEVLSPTGGNGTYTYIWEASVNNGPWEEVASGTDPEFTPGNIMEETRFRRLVTSGPCGPEVSNIVTISVLPGLNPGIIASDQNICYNSTPTTITNTEAASGGEGAGTYNYQWQMALASDPSNWSDIIGETGTTYAPGALTTTTLYRRVVVSGTGICNTSMTDPVTIHVYEDLEPGTIGADQNICEGDIPDELIELSPATGGTEQYTYQWESTVDNGSNWTLIAGATSASYLSPALTQTTAFRRNVTSGACGTVTSQEIVINVTPNVAVDVTIGDPGDICANEPVVFEATPVNEGTNPTYTWHVDGIPVSGANGPIFTTSTLQDQQRVTVVLNSSIGCTTNNPATSNEVVMQVKDAVVPSVSINTPSEICAGTNVIFNAIPSGGGDNPTFEWFVNGSPQGISGASYSNDQLNDGDEIHVIMTSNSLCLADPNAPDAQSNTHTMNVVDNVPVSVTINEPDKICAGATVTYNAVAVNQGLTPTYQWYVNGQPRGMNSPTFTPTNLPVGQNNVSVMVTSSLNCVLDNPASSNVHTLTVDPVLPVSVSIQGPQVTLCEEDNAVFTANPVNPGTNPQYVWSVAGVIQAETSNQFVSNTIRPGQRVTVELTSSEECQTGPATANFTPDIFEIPVVSIAPSPVNICQGSTQPLRPRSDTDLPNGSSVEWFRDSVSLGVHQWYPANSAGSYHIEVTFPYGCSTTSDPTEVKVIDVQEPVINEADTTICEDEYMKFTVDNTIGQLQWYRNGILMPGETDATLNVNQPGSYTVVESILHCTALSNEANLQVVSIPNANAGMDQTVLEGSPVQLFATGGETYEWFPTVGLSDANVQNPIFMAEDNITYTVTVSNGRCSAEDEVNIIVQKPIVVRNSFTPNGDNINDTWFIENLDRFPSARIEIYNRWGTLVWLSDGPAEWNGTNFRNGEILPVATYYYVIILNSEIFDKPYTGHVTIVR
ncbi:gliding motility-associated C-terminal domain-containing protein [Cytophagaceae bacterium ABcell3]|nr:gliding motility-associated C-terminal domain-containing protein [Cytophagaceae bacterium ABcell3]